MTAWIESIAGPEYATALTWTIFALVALLVLLVVIRIVRGLTSGTFIAGGRNRKARLAVLDATAVDSQRRLVLVRRDDVEHLILIGGTTDVVVEQGIRATGQMRRPAPEDARPVPPEAVRQQPAAAPRPRPEPQPRTVAAPVAAPTLPPAPEANRDDPVLKPAAGRPVAEPAPVPAPPLVQPARPAAQAEPRLPPSPVVHAPEPRPAAPVPASDPAPATGQFATMKPVVAAPVIAAPAGDDLDDALLQELQVTLDREAKPAPEPAAERELALDEEMSRLLGNISREQT